MAYEAKAGSFPHTAPTTFTGSFAPASGLDAYQAKMKVAQEAIITRCERDEAAEQARASRRPSTFVPGLPRVFFEVKADNQPLGRTACWTCRLGSATALYPGLLGQPLPAPGYLVKCAEPLRAQWEAAVRP